jgi:D-inositol-3-phosphate glycosyltransferase
MKICTISYHSCPYSSLGGNGSGGMSVYLREVLASLVGYPEVKVDILTRAQNAACVEAKYISPQIRVIQLKGGPERPIDRKYLYEFIPEFSENCEQYIRRNKEEYDIIHSHYWLSGLAGGYIKHRLGIPLVHNYHTLGFMKKRALDEIEHKSRAVSERHLAQVSDMIISPSSEERESLVEEFGILPAKVRVVHPGVNPRLFFHVDGRRVRKKAGFQKDDFILLFVGRIEPLKGLRDLITALKILREESPALFEKTKLIVVGGGEKDGELAANAEVSRIKREIERFGLRKNVAFLGSVEQGKLRNVYSAANALVVPSLYESFGLVTVEALACGTAVVVSQIDKMKSIVREGKNGFSFFPGNPVSLCQSLEKFYRHRDRFWSRTAIREDVIHRFSWEKTAEKTYRIFEDTIQGSPRAKTIFRPGESLLPV